jgi:hypothetical protein
MATDGLAKANARRHQSAVVAAQGAIERLCREGAAVNFAAVSRAAGVSRTWLYREAELYDSIGRLRSSAPPAPRAEVAQRASTSSLRQRLEGAKAEISRLRAENNALRDQLARQLGARRAQPTSPSVTSPR